MKVVYVGDRHSRGKNLAKKWRKKSVHASCEEDYKKDKGEQRITS